MMKHFKILFSLLTVLSGISGVANAADTIPVNVAAGTTTPEIDVTTTSGSVKKAITVSGTASS